MPNRAPDARVTTGRRAEDLACAHMQAAGYHIVCRNWRRPEGEIDIIATQGETCVFIEVRSRTGHDTSHPLETITPRKRAQVIRTARLFLDLERPSATGYRFDAFGVVFAADGSVLECTHVENAFDASPR